MPSMSDVRSIRARAQLPPGMAATLLGPENAEGIGYIETVLLPRASAITVTGAPGKTVEDLIRAAQGYVWSHAGEFGIHPRLFRRFGLHVHFPVDGDYAAAGLAIAASLLSIYSGCPIARDVAMTGATPLTGLVLPVSRVRDRVMAARAAGYHTLILPRDNEVELRGCADSELEGTSLVFVDAIQGALETALPELMQRLAAM